MPSLLVLGCLGLLFLNDLKLHLPFAELTLLLTIVVGLLSILIASIAQFTRKQPWHGAINLIALPVVGWIVFRGIGFLFVSALFNDEPDNFGKNIVIPAGMEVIDPVDRFSDDNAPANDSFTDSIIAAFKEDPKGNPASQVAPDLALLNDFGTANRTQLIRYLSSSPKWFVTEERGKMYAYRRLLSSGRLANSLNGFYSFDLGNNDRFQTRIVIGFDGPVFVSPFAGRGIVTSVPAGKSTVLINVVDDKESHQGQESYLVITSNRATLEIFEQSLRASRVVTPLAVAEVRRELAEALATSTSPPIAKKGDSGIALAKGMQGGIYQVRAFANPGASGKVYLKVFEATQNIRLSAERLTQKSTARIGWSEQPTEKFLYSSGVTVYEGDWGTFYPARFELWFVPESGGPERKLVEKIFRIEGWQR